MKKIDLRNCKKGDILISSQGAKLEYISPTPWGSYTYLDHVVRYLVDKDGKSMGEENYGTRTHDGFVFSKHRIPESDHDIVEILESKPKIRVDVNGFELKTGDVIDLHQTVNGENKFVILNTEPLDVRYAHDLNYKYQYDQEELFKPCEYSGETEFEIIDNIYEFLKRI